MGSISAWLPSLRSTLHQSGAVFVAGFCCGCFVSHWIHSLLDYLIEYLRGGSGWLHSKSDRAGDTAATRVVTVDQKRSGESVEQSWCTGNFLV